MALHLPAHSLSNEPPSPVTGVHLNSDGSVFSTSTVQGWIVYRTQPLQVLTRRDLPDASLRIVLPLERSNLLFLVGGPPSPLYPPNKVVLWDDRARAPVAELEFREDVRGLAARRDRLVVVLRRRVVVFVLPHGGAGIWREGGYETTDNPKGLVALASAPGATLLAFPGRQPGQVQLVHLPPLDRSSAPLPPPPSHDPLAAPHPAVSVLLAHESALSALATTPDGRVLATSSQRGTLVRVWDATASGFLLRELRRGTDSAEIFAIALSADGARVAVSSDKGTVHCWDLRREERDRAEGGSESGASTPRQKQFSLLKPYLPKYFSSSWSHAQFRLPPPGPTASRLPFSLSNPGPYPATPFSPARTGAGADPPTVENDICVCAWIEVDAPDPGPDVVAGDSRAGTPVPPLSGRHGSTSSASAARARKASTEQPAPPPPPRKEPQLVALTRSGGWFRIAFSPAPGPSSSSGAAPAPALAPAPVPVFASASASSKGKERAASSGSGSGSGSGRATPTRTAPRVQEGVQGLARDATSECRLVEYRRFGGTEGW
ncbi:hypothetical protein JCM3770_000301 [Rhodotorula araucariae]